MDFGQILKTNRLANGITQEDLANTLQLSRNYISQLENNRKVPAPHLVKKIAKILKLSELELFISAYNIEE